MYKKYSPTGEEFVDPKQIEDLPEDAKESLEKGESVTIGHDRYEPLKSIDE